MYQVIGSNHKETGNNNIPRMALMDSKLQCCLLGTIFIQVNFLFSMKQVWLKKRNRSFAERNSKMTAS